MVTKIPADKNRNGRVAVQDGELYYECTGRGAPLILIHAGLSDRREWKYQTEEFGSTFQTIVYDQRGAGNSSIPTAAFWPADDLKALMDHLGLEKANLMGHSIGGTVALDFVLRYPERVSSLILVASGVNGYQWSKEYQDWFSSIWTVPETDKMMKQMVSADFYAKSMSKQELRSEIETITYENIQKILSWKSSEVRCFFSDPISKLNEVRIPTLVVYGNKDSQDIKQIANILIENIPNVKSVQILDADHLLNFERPKELNSRVMDFVLNLDNGS